ncbi:hypothetical protein DSO57_1017493 [Entomophthora muscae]|uniref:Uncharacterized protein n=1 Tax=Entomophthora muscae TaxID=34485 RepID=A0ACC2TS86_9FUNG|nr:hypothetical protein DSO57_1017493 [Entomophthora muscae]
MNHLIFTAVLTVCLGIGGYQQGSQFFEPSPDGLGHDPHYDPGQLNSSQTGPWPPLVSPHSTLSIAMYTFMYYILTYFAGSFGRYNVHVKALLLADDRVPYCYRLDWVPVHQPVAIHPVSGTYCNWVLQLRVIHYLGMTALNLLVAILFLQIMMSSTQIPM